MNIEIAARWDAYTICTECENIYTGQASRYMYDRIRGRSAVVKRVEHISTILLVNI